MSELNKKEREEYIGLINKYRNLFNKIYNKYPIIFEHGDIDNSNISSVSHAHTHIVNYNFKNELNIINELNFNLINSINEIKNNTNYIMYLNESKKIYVTYNYNSISQLMRILIAKDKDIGDKYNWKNNKFSNNIKLTIDKIKDNI